MITAVFSSHLGQVYDNKFISHLKKTSGIKNMEVICYPNMGQHSLSSLYNKALEQAKYDKIALIHNDIEFLSQNWGLTLSNVLDEYDIIGVAGSKSLYPYQKGCWWLHRLGGLSSDMIGQVWHENNGQKYPSVYSKAKGIEDAVLIDGVFIGLNRKYIKKPFIEYSNFHFYDIPFCISNFIQGCTIGVTHDISLLHKSVGRVNNEWEQARQKFFNDFPNEYSVKEPYSLDIELIYDPNGTDVSVIVPFSENRRDFFDSVTLPSIKSNKPKEIIIVKGDYSAPIKRNYGFEKSSQPYVFFCDDDIELKDNHFMLLLNNLKGTDYAYSYTGYKGIVHHKTSHPIGKDFTIDSMPFNIEALKKSNYISTMSLIKREYFIGFDDRLNRLQDWDLWLGIYFSHKKEGVFVDSPFKAHYLDEGITSKKNDSTMAINLIRSKYRL